MRERLTRGWLLLVVAAFCLPLFVGLGASDLGNDEAIYSYAVESILDTGDWLSPRSSPNLHITFLEKPPLKFWIVAAPIALGLLPRSEFGLRFWDAVFGSLAFLYVFLIGRRLAGPVCGVVAVLVLFAHAPLIFEHGLRSNNMEAPLLLAYCGGVHHYLAWTASASRRRGTAHVAAVTAFFFLGFMTKFVASLFLPLVLALSALLVPTQRRMLRRDWFVWAAGAAAFVACAAPWFVYQYWKQGSQLLDVMFGEHVYTRFTAFADPSHLQPWHFYFSQLVVELQRSHSLLWVAFGVAVFAAEAVRVRLGDGVLLLVWAVLPLTLISFGTSKIYHYVYPFLPPFALFAGYGAAWLWRHATRLTEPLAARLPVRAGQLTRAAWRRRAAILVLALSVTAAVATVIEGAWRIEVGGRVLLSNSTVLRPLMVALIALMALGGVRAAAAVVLLLVVALVLPTPVTAYERNLVALRRGRQPLGHLAACIRSVHEAQWQRGQHVPGVYAPVSHEAFDHPYFYYLRGSGWHLPLRDEVVREALGAGPQRPVVTDAERYQGFVARNPDFAVAAVPLRTGEVVILLPAEFAHCAATMK
ncbi:MAG TPA: hypothetical protein VM364_21960 [Vicinamibacterales bacterium]|nr:hypothetical protein [Vicinamibacterales bacterium]